MMTAAEIRADLLATLRSAARGYEQLSQGRAEIAGLCEQQADHLRAVADDIQDRHQPQPEILKEAA